MNEIYSSSGSEHEPDSAHLHEMVLLFMHEEQEEETGNSTPFAGELSHPDEDKKLVARSQEQINMLKTIISDSSEADTNLLLAEIAKFTQQMKKQQHCGSLQRSVTRHLRSMGYNAAICKSQPRQDKSFPPCKYEYIDVIVKSIDGKNTRLLIDMEFRAQFELARPTEEYIALVQLLPTVYVGTTDRLLKIVKIMSDGVKVSLKRKGMHVPPWRTLKYMHSRWLGSYKRTTDSSTPREVKRESCHAWKSCDDGEKGWVDWDCSEGLLNKRWFHQNNGEKKLIPRLGRALMEAGLTSTSKAKPSSNFVEN